MGRGKADPMRHIRRAAVTGLFAIWLAPLAAQGNGRTADAGAEAAQRGSRLVVEDRQAVSASNRLDHREVGAKEARSRA